MYMRMVRVLKASPLLELVEMTCNAQQTYDPYPDAPLPLRNHAWDQPKLRQWLWFTPLVLFPTREIDLPLLWRGSQHGVNKGILDHIESLVNYIKTRLESDVRSWNDRLQFIEALDSGIAWLTSKPVSDWYRRVPPLAQKAFSSWIVDLHNSTRASLAKAGGLITLSYLVCLSLQTPSPLLLHRTIN